MGLFSSIQTAIGAASLKIASIFSPAVREGIQVQGGILEATKAGLESRTPLQVKAANIGTAAVLAIPLVVAPQAVASGVVSAAKFFNPLTAGGAVRTVGGLAGYGLLTSSPTAAKTALNAPSNLINFGSNIGKFVENPSVENLTTIGKENPYLTAGAAALGLYGVGKVASGVATALNTSAERANTKSIEEQNKILSQAGATNLPKAEEAAAPITTTTKKKAQPKPKKKVKKRSSKAVKKKKAKKKVYKPKKHKKKSKKRSKR